VQANLLRSTSRASRVTSPAALNAGFSPASYSINAREMPWRTAPAWRFRRHVYVDDDVEARMALGELERLAHDHAAGLAPEEIVHRLAVNDELALAGLQKDAGHSALAPPVP